MASWNPNWLAPNFFSTSSRWGFALGAGNTRRGVGSRTAKGRGLVSTMANETWLSDLTGSPATTLGWMGMNCDIHSYFLLHKILWSHSKLSISLATRLASANVWGFLSRRPLIVPDLKNRRVVYRDGTTPSWRVVSGRTPVTTQYGPRRVILGGS